MKHREQNAPLYTEAQATAWLAWLARGMQQHGQTLFLIEQLQPSWLSTRRQRWVYILTSRLIWGVVIGLFGGLIFGLNGGLISRLIDGLIVGLMIGLTGGLVFGLTDAARFARTRSRSMHHASATPRQIIGDILLFGLIGGLIFGLIIGLIFGPIDGLIFGLMIGLTFGFIWALRSLGRNPSNEIQTVETIRFSLAHLRQGIVSGLIIGLIIGLIYGRFGGLIGGLFYGRFGGLIGGLIIGLIVGLIVGLLTCLRPGIQELKTIPNQGIRLSLRNGSLMGGLGGLALGLSMGQLNGWTYGLVAGALGGLCIGLWYGGLDVIQHYIVRILLWRAGAMPRDYARFLDYAAEELTFLQKVGGGYIFVHRYLLEYFAAMDLPGQPVAADGDTVSQPVVNTGESV